MSLEVGSICKQGSGARSACLIIIAIIFFVSPASASEKTESVDIKESTFFQSENKVFVQNLRKRLGTQIPLTFDQVILISPSSLDTPPARSKLYILYRSFKLLD